MTTLRGRHPATLMLVVVLLSGCAAAPPSPSPSSRIPAASAARTPALPSAPSPAPPPAPAAADAPRSILDISCEEALPAEERSLLTTAALTADPAADAELGWVGGPLSFAPRQVGGLSCAWTDGEDELIPSGVPGDPVALNPAHVGITATVIPADTGPGTRGIVTEDPKISGTCFGGRCVLQQLVGDLWVRLLLTGFPDDAVTAADATLDALSARVDAAPRVAFSWTAPPGTRSLTSCDQLVPEADLQGVFGVDDELIWIRPAGGWNLDAATSRGVGAEPCLPSYTDRDGGPNAYVSWLPGGEWAWRSAPPSGEVLTLPGAVETRLACVATSCTVDLLTGRNWVRVSAWSADGDESAGRSTAVTLATRISENLAG